jgi:lipopolysaccharide transport system ATP-binding protein
MNVRLGFSVAAHLEPEILLVDEVLAVGDAEFQKKCLGKMGTVASAGRTVLFVSHNMGAVRALCHRAVLLEKGQLAGEGTAPSVVASYLDGSGHPESSGSGLWENPLTQADRASDVALMSVSLVGSNGQRRALFSTEQAAKVEIEYQVNRKVAALRVVLGLVTGQGVLAFTSYEDSAVREGRVVPPGRYRAVCAIPPDLLNAGSYSVNIGLDAPKLRMLVPTTPTVSLQVQDTSPRSLYPQGAKGVVRPKLLWTTTELPPSSTGQSPGTATPEGGRHDMPDLGGSSA